MHSSTYPDGLLLGVDIGTTTLSFTVADVRAGALIASRTLPNDSALPACGEGLHEQDAERIAGTILRTTGELLSQYPAIRSIGLTGQMHGVLLVDGDGRAVSPLYTWQDERANRAMADGTSCCDAILARTGHRVSSGFGHATLYYNAENGLLPSGAVSYCTIMDYAAMRLTGSKSPLMHSSNAASLGLYDCAANAFDASALRAIRLSSLRTPQTTGEVRILGRFGGVPVCTAIGDNQASFYGSVRDEARSLLVNYGTGSQLSMVCDSPCAADGAEIRPYLFGQYLLCRSALCGGRAYAVLERFFAAYAGAPAGSQYEAMNRLAEAAYAAGGGGLEVSTLFCGTRENPGLRGHISGVSDSNFTPENLILGVLQGMVDELAAGFDRAAHPQITELIASGNAARKNPVLLRLLSDTFGMRVRLPGGREEAALGAALLGGVCAGVLRRDEAKAFIRYEDEKI